MVVIERGKYKRKVGNMLNYFGLCEYRVLIYTKVEILIIWNEGERIESKEWMQGSLN